MIIPAHQLSPLCLGRGNGAMVDQELRRLLSLHARLTLDFMHITVMDGVFADAAFGVMASDRCLRTFTAGPIVFANMLPDIQRNLGMALICRAAETSVRNCVVPGQGYNGMPSLVGKTEQYIEDTWRLLQQCPSLTAPALAAMLNLAPNAASTRLKWVWDLGLCLRVEERTKEGRQFIYRRIDQE